jgi:hypothetical protein
MTAMARITRKEDKANCLSLGELCSSQLVKDLEISIARYYFGVYMGI